MPKLGFMPIPIPTTANIDPEVIHAKVQHWQEMGYRHDTTYLMVNLLFAVYDYLLGNTEQAQVQLVAVTCLDARPDAQACINDLKERLQQINPDSGRALNVWRTFPTCPCDMCVAACFEENYLISKHNLTNFSF